ncbi:MAG: hypothetical protein OEV08_04780, partial [Nitrospira sp.]|nr:hypothetical protein [Nitrospira sp.]
TPLMVESSLGRSYPSDANWAIAEQLALCTLSTHTSLIRHWNWVHLIGGEALSIVTRNTLPEDHPFCRLLWPHIFGTQASNRLCTESQLVPGGDFESVFSYAHKEMYGLFTDTVGAFDVQDWDPQAASAKRGILPEGMDLPTGNNLEALFDVMYRHTTRYLSMYYASDAEVRADRGICQWVDELSKALPNGLPMTPETLTQASLARFASSCIYFASVQHDLVGAFLWNYQLWTHAMPVQVACDGRRESLDVYQRLVNTNFMLNTPRAPLMSDLTAIALPDSVRPDRRVRAVDAFVRFREELIALQQMMEREPWMPWKLYPKNLEVNINA